MYPNYNMYYNNRNMRYAKRPNNYGNNNRFGGFVVPFLLGGLAGGAIANGRPNQNPNYYYPYPYYYNNNNFFYPPYGPYYY